MIAMLIGAMYGCIVQSFGTVVAVWLQEVRPATGGTLWRWSHFQLVNYVYMISLFISCRLFVQVPCVTMYVTSFCLITTPMPNKRGRYPVAHRWVRLTRNRTLLVCLIINLVAVVEFEVVMLVMVVATLVRASWSANDWRLWQGLPNLNTLKDIAPLWRGIIDCCCNTNINVCDWNQIVVLTLWLTAIVAQLVKPAIGTNFVSSYSMIDCPCSTTIKPAIGNGS
jgi:hypothetical protein